MQVCLVDLVLLGVLLVLNCGVVEWVICFGFVIGLIIVLCSIFVCKNYFYFDLLKGYQISQYEILVVQGGQIMIQVLVNEKVGKVVYEKMVNLICVYFEEDVGKLLYEDFVGMIGIDLNCVGMLLFEIVIELEMCSVVEVVVYVKVLYGFVVWFGICDGNMQEGLFCCDVNVLVCLVGQEKFGMCVEIKNLNLFWFFEEVINYEVCWQIELIEDGGEVVQEMCFYDLDKCEMCLMCSKEDVYDYCYFFDFDLMLFVIGQDWIECVQFGMLELLVVMQQCFVDEYGVFVYDVGVLMLSKVMVVYFEVVVVKVGVVNVKIVVNWLMGDVLL